MMETQLKYNPAGRHYRLGFRLYPAIALILFFSGRLLIAPNAVFAFSSGTQNALVMIDPGHGGADTGGAGHGGALEKDIALTLSSLVTAELNRKPHTEAVQTRNDDYSLPLFDRTSKANRTQADVFISIHTGGGFACGSDSISVFYNSRPAGLEKVLQSGIHESNSFHDWTSIQFLHLESSRKLAAIVKRELMKQSIRFETVYIDEAPLTVLEGADMPAVLIEIGCVNDPLHEEWLSDHRILASLAKRIASAVNSFLISRRP